MGVIAVWRCLYGVVGLFGSGHTTRYEVRNDRYSGMLLGRAATEGESPVCDMTITSETAPE
jgi:hypothetical protein